MSLEDNIQTLNYFGLSHNQAKVYIAIGSTNFLSVREIQRRANVPRQEIYRILNTLQEIGLVERTIQRPQRWKGLPIKVGITHLLQQKTQEISKMQIKAEKMMKQFHQQNNNHLNEIKPSFVIIPKNEASIIRRKEEINNAKKCIDFISSWKRFPRTIETFGENEIKSLEKGVKMRVILENPKDMKQMPEIMQKLKKFPNYELRYIINQPLAIIGIFDKERAIIKTSASVGLAEESSLWTNNPCLLSVIHDYFEIMWITAMEKIPEILVDQYTI